MTTQQKLIKSKLNLLELGSYLGNVSEACRTLGYSRDTFYRLKKQYEENGLDGLQEISRRKPNLRNRVPEEVEEAVCVRIEEAIQGLDGIKEITSTASEGMGLVMAAGNARACVLALKIPGYLSRAICLEL